METWKTRSEDEWGNVFLEPIELGDRWTIRLNYQELRVRSSGARVLLWQYTLISGHSIHYCHGAPGWWTMEAAFAAGVAQMEQIVATVAAIEHEERVA